MCDAMEADAVITGVVGDAIELTEAQRDHKVPSLTGTLIPAQQGERFVTMSWQLDVFARSLPDAIQVGERLLALFDHDVRKWIGGLNMWIRCTDEMEFHGPVDDQTYRRSLVFEVEVIRRRYVRAEES